MENSAYLALPLFAGLAAGDIPAALAALDALCRPFAKGETLLEAGQRGAPMGVVLAGRVLIEHLDLWGNRTLLGRAAEGELFAETYAFLPDQPMLVSVVAAERGEALFLDPGKLMAPGCEPWRWQMMQNLLHILAGKNLNLARRSLYTAPKTIRERVTAYFSTLAVQKGSLEFELPFCRASSWPTTWASTAVRCPARFPPCSATAC